MGLSSRTYFSNAAMFNQFLLMPLRKLYFDIKMSMFLLRVKLVVNRKTVKVTSNMVNRSMNAVI
jgi:hypothetical protein